MKVNHSSIIGGGVARLGNSFRGYIGAGAAKLSICYPDNPIGSQAYQWGFATDVGLLFNWRSMGFRAGTTISFNNGVRVIPSVGIGVFL